MNKKLSDIAYGGWFRESNTILRDHALGGWFIYPYLDDTTSTVEEKDRKLGSITERVLYTATIKERK